MDLIFQFEDYRRYLAERLGGRGSRTGEKKRASLALRVHTTLISQVLGGQCGLSLEQADRMNGFLGHSEDESEYFLTLVQRERAGTQSLKTRFNHSLRKMKERHLQVHRRLEKSGEISQENQRRFYSSYMHSAIHVLVSIARYNSVDKLAQGLGLPRVRIAEAVTFLSSIGVIRNDNGKLSPGSQHIHLSPESEHLGRHHLNWRLQMIERLGQPNRQDLHYSSVVSLSHADAEKIKNSILNNLKENSMTIMKSPEETAYVYCFDFFKLPVDESPL